MDWDGNPIVHTCYDKRIVPNRSTTAIMYCVLMPKYYVVSICTHMYTYSYFDDNYYYIIYQFEYLQAMHKCMYEKIEYDEAVPV